MPQATAPSAAPDELFLTAPDPRYAAQVMAYKAEYLAHGDLERDPSCLHGGAGLEDCATYAEWSDFAGRLRKKYGERYVPADVYLAIRRADDRLVGMLDFRHPLTPEMRRFAGHIGFSVRPGERGRGYGRTMLRLLLPHCRAAGEKEVLLSCARENIASARTITGGGGVLVNEVPDAIGLSRSGIIRRYAIDLRGIVPAGMRLVPLNRDNLTENSLDAFVRTQPGAAVWRRGADGAYRLEKLDFVMDWPLETKRENARELAGDGVTARGIFTDGTLIAFTSLRNALRDGRMIMEMMQVSRPFRGRGLGRLLFTKARGIAAAAGAREIYISACPSAETVAFYRAMGAEITAAPLPDMAAAEPEDLQMVCPLR